MNKLNTRTDFFYYHFLFPFQLYSVFNFQQSRNGLAPLWLIVEERSVASFAEPEVSCFCPRSKLRRVARMEPDESKSIRFVHCDLNRFPYLMIYVLIKFGLIKISSEQRDGQTDFSVQLVISKGVFLLEQIQLIIHVEFS